MDGRGGTLRTANSRSRITHHASRTCMDRKSITAIVLCVSLLLFWALVIVPKIRPSTPWPPVVTNAAATTPSAMAPATSNAEAPAMTPPLMSAATAPQPAFPTNAPEQTVVMTNDNARYTFTSRGGGLKLVELVRYPETISKRSRKQSPANDVATLNTRAFVPVLAGLGGASVEGDGIFTLTQTATGVRAEKALTNGLRLVKEFQLSTNYLINATVRLENNSGQPVNVPAQQWAVGTATPMGPDDKGLAVGVMWYDSVRNVDINQFWFDNRSLGCVPGVPRAEYRAGSSNVVWAAMHNQFFTLVAMPKQPAMQIVSWPVILPPTGGQPLRHRLHQRAAPRGSNRFRLSSRDARAARGGGAANHFLRRPQGISHAGAHRRAVQQQCGPGDGLRRLFRILFQGVVAGNELAA